MKAIGWILIPCLGITVFYGCSEPSAPPQTNTGTKASTTPQVPVSQPPATFSNTVAAVIEPKTNVNKEPKCTETPILPQSATYSNTVALANKLISGAGQKWGDPLEVRWQSEPFNRYVVIYLTSELEKALLGDRAVLVTTNGQASFAPRE
jgi:hypothetical protein